MLPHPERLPVWLAVGILSVGGIVLYRFLKKQKRKCLSWMGTPIYVCTTVDDWVKNEKYFLGAMYKSKVIGLDCEWVCKGHKRLPVSLLQIAAPDVCVVLRMTSLMKEPALPSTLIHLLEDSSVLKLGFEISHDVKKLHKDFGILVKGYCDLRFVTDNIPEFQNVSTKSLRDMAKNVAGIELNKSSQLRCSNWEAERLSTGQVLYAAADAIVSMRIFDALIEKISEMPMGKLHKFSSSSIEERPLITKFIDLPYASRTGSPGRINSQVIAERNTSLNMKIGRYQLPVRQRPLYDNCVLVAPDGEQLCICKLKKIRWYEKKGLGEVICEDPLTLQLKFEPADRPILDKEYYTFEKDNCCVVCGCTKNLVKKFVVPSEYRRFFPEMMKSHLSHDILLLCIPCHQHSNNYDTILRQELVKECDAPLGSAANLRKKTHPGLGRVKSAARAIVCNRERLPSDRLEELEKRVKDFYNVSELTPDILSMASDMDVSYWNDEYVAHGEKVVNHMSRRECLLAFEKRWRQHFLDTMKPRYLPKMWSVTHGHEWLALKVLEGGVDFDPEILGLSEEQLEVACRNKSLIDGLRNASA